MRFRWFIYALTIILIIVGVAVEKKLERIDLDIALREQREKTVRELAPLASRIEAETYSTFYLIVGLARLVEINGGISEKQFEEIC
ncbi:MAG: hypothetical protein WBA93_08590, partial [Microcoleaceae cyanobacterium]